MRDKERGVFRVLASAAQYHGKTVLNKKEEKAYQEAYNYLLNLPFVITYVDSINRLPCGSLTAPPRQLVGLAEVIANRS
jgi:hypothetical protein